MLKMESHGHGKYDSIAAFTFRTDTGKVGRVVQDVVTLPSKKWARVQGEKGYIEWTCNGSPSGDLVHFMTEGEELEEKVFSKKRPDDFFAEMQHIDDLIGGRADSSASPISLQSAVSVMAVLNAAYAAQNSGAYIEIKKL
jgi:predicted dehydrogenase